MGPRPHHTRRLRVLLLAMLALAMLALAAPAWAEPQAELAPSPDAFATLSDAEFEAMLARLSDEQVRDILIQQFATQQAAREQPSAGLIEDARTIGEELSTNARALIAKWDELDEAYWAVIDRLEQGGGVGYALLALVVTIGVGLVARYFWRGKAARQQGKLAERNIAKGSFATVAIIGDAGVWLLMEVSSALIFALAAMATLYLFFNQPDIAFFVSSYAAAITVVLIVRSIVAWMFPPGFRVYRLVDISDRATRTLHWVVTLLAAVWAVQNSTAAVMYEFQAPAGTAELIGVFMSVIWLLVALIGVSLVHRQTADLLPTREQKGFVNRLSRNWALLMGGALFLILALFIIGGLMAGAAEEVAMANLTVLSIAIGFWAMHRILAHYLRAQDLSEELKGAILRAARAILLVTGFWISLYVWGLDPATLEAAGVTGQVFLAFVDVAFTALIGWTIWDFIRTLIDQRIAAESPAVASDEGADGEGGLGASRSATMLPLLRSAALAVIGLTCLFAAASSLGLNVAPLIAGAGVVGLAIGFGAQTLVKDIVSGVFFLIDDAFRRGEYIDLGDVKGTVERISVRSLQLRHHLGAVHTIPFGDISALTNYSRDWVIMKLPLRLTYDTDPQVVKKIIKRIGAEMMEDDLVGSGFLEPPKSQGVIEMDDSAMILRVKFKAIPGKQFTIRRELLHRIRAAFEEAGIRFANREVTVRFNEDATPAERIEAAGAAAVRALET